MLNYSIKIGANFDSINHYTWPNYITSSSDIIRYSQHEKSVVITSLFVYYSKSFIYRNGLVNCV